MSNQHGLWNLIIKRLMGSSIGRKHRATTANPERPGVLELYTTSAPNPQNALDIFQGDWVSQFPEPLASLRAGPLPIFEDSRID